MKRLEFIKVSTQSQENPGVHWRGYLKHPLRKKRVSWHWCACRRSSNTSPYDFSCFADCVWRCHTPGMDWICSLPSQDLRCSNQLTRCSDICNCIILQCPSCDVTAASSMFAHAHICFSWICRQDKSTHAFCYFVCQNMRFKKYKERNNQTPCGPGVNTHKSTEQPPLTWCWFDEHDEVPLSLSEPSSVCWPRRVLFKTHKSLPLTSCL